MVRSISRPAAVTWCRFCCRIIHIYIPIDTGTGGSSPLQGGGWVAEATSTGVSLLPLWRRREEVAPGDISGRESSMRLRSWSKARTCTFRAPALHGMERLHSCWQRQFSDFEASHETWAPSQLHHSPLTTDILQYLMAIVVDNDNDKYSF
jgi:hypothetical protein